MKKLMLLTAFTAISGICMAQASFGIQAGPYFGMGKLKYDNAAFTSYTTHSDKNKMNVGFLGGFVAEIPFGTSIAFRPELNFVQQGTRSLVSGTTPLYTFEAEQKISLNYLQVPLNFIYKVPAGGGTFFVGLGPSIEVGLSGKNRYTYTSATDPLDNEEDTYKVKFDGKKSDDITDPADDDNHLKRLDIGANVLLGYKMSMGLFVKVGYSHGLRNIDPNKDNEFADERSTYKNSGISLNIGYMFGGGSKKK